jgi:hypothetical protein
MSGKGVMIWPNGISYDGNFLNDKMHGHGTLTFPDSRKYCG